MGRFPSRPDEDRECGIGRNDDFFLILILLCFCMGNGRRGKHGRDDCDIFGGDNFFLIIILLCFCMGNNRRCDSFAEALEIEEE